MFEEPITTVVEGGIVYRDGLGWPEATLPLLCVHGVGGHHRNYAPLHAKLRVHAPRVTPVFVDLPGFGHVQGTVPSLRRVQDFLAAACSYVEEACGHPVVLFLQSAAVWFTLGFALHPAVSSHVVIAYNPVRVYRPSTATLRELLGQDVMDVRNEFLTRFFPPERIRKMDEDELGRPTVPLTFLAELWGVQRKSPLEGWRRAVVIQTRLDPMREFRIPLAETTIERFEIDSSQHGMGEDNVVREIAEIVQRVLDPT